MSNFLQVNRLQFHFIWVLLIMGCMMPKSNAQNAAFDFGIGPFICVGLQQEWAIQLRTGYHTPSKFYYLAEYSSYFRRNVDNNEQFNEAGVSVNYPIFDILGFEVYGGLGYVVYFEPINRSGNNTSTFFIATGDINHGAQLKFQAHLPVSDRLHIFSEYNFKSFGKRFDTFGFGLLYQIEFL